MNRVNTQSMLICFEGVDLVGKSTLIEKMSEQCRCVKMKCPDIKLPSGEIISQALKRHNDIPHSELDRLFCDNRLEVSNEVLKYVTSEIHKEPVFMDRFIASGLIYSRNNKIIKCPEHFDVLVRPTCTLYISDEVAERVRVNGPDLYESVETRSRLSKGFESYYYAVDQCISFITEDGSTETVWFEIYEFNKVFEMIKTKTYKSIIFNTNMPAAGIVFKLLPWDAVTTNNDEDYDGSPVVSDELVTQLCEFLKFLSAKTQLTYVEYPKN